MKRVIGMVFSMLFVLTQTSAQKVEDIIALPLQITIRKTSNLIFPTAVSSVDRGSPDVLVQKAKGLENVLQVKAARESFPETNMTVITDDGRLYAFTLAYSDHPQQLNLKLLPTDQLERNALFEKPSEHELEQTAMELASRTAFFRRKRAIKNGVVLRLKGIYVHQKVMYYVLNIENHTRISYDVSQFRLSIRDKKSARRTASQGLELPILLAFEKPEGIPGELSQQIVVAVPKRTIPDQKMLIIQLMEENGGRHLALRLKNRHIIKARPV